MLAGEGDCDWALSFLPTSQRPSEGHAMEPNLARPGPAHTVRCCSWSSLCLRPQMAQCITGPVTLAACT